MAKSEVKNPLFLLVFGVIGLLLMGGGIYFYQQSVQLMETGVVTEGTVTDIDRTSVQRPSYRAKIEFTTENGERISFNYSIRHSYSLSVGEKVPVLYLRDNPSIATKDSWNGIWLKPLGTLGIGLLFSLAGFWTFFYMRNKKRLKASLATRGRKITAKVLEINGVGGTNNQCTIWAQYQENGKSYLYTSEPIQLPPEALQDLKTIEITVDPNNLKKYFFDTERIVLEHSDNVEKEA